MEITDQEVRILEDKNQFYEDVSKDLETKFSTLVQEATEKIAIVHKDPDPKGLNSSRPNEVLSKEEGTPNGP